MSQTDVLRAMFEAHGGRLTLGQIMQSYLAASYRQRTTDLKRELFSDGKTIVCYPNHKEGHKSETYWQIEDLPAPVTYIEPSGQMAMVIR
jgi:hypothetical protein